MRALTKTLWIAAFLLATYSWMVAFEHGFGWEGFSSGFATEWKNLGSLLVGKTTPSA
jgi:hypothetical protein